MTTILIVEDCPETNDAICEFLMSLGYKVLSALSGNDAMDIIDERGPKVELIILDIMLPDINGIELLGIIRRQSETPVLMLTALNDERTQVMCFDGLADDYIVKPFSMLLLGKRVASLLRRCGKITLPNKISFGDVIIDFKSYSAFSTEGVEISVTPKEIDLLKLLVEAKGIVLTRAHILETLWFGDTNVSERLIDTYIKNLRRKLKLDCIVTVKGVGYKYET